MNSKSYIISAVLFVAVALWMASGYLFGASEDSRAEQRDTDAARPAMTVQVREFQSESIVRQLENQGEVVSNRQLQVRAETTGRVEEVIAAKGARVEAGDPVLRLAMEDRQARLEQAQALIDQRQAEYEAAQRLGTQGYQSEADTRGALAALRSAEAQLAAIRKEIDDTVVTAPFGGIVNERLAEVGDYVVPGDPVVRLLDNDPLEAVVHVAQQDVPNLSTGTRADVELATGEQRTGEVTFIASAADPQTRTFRVEISVPNPEGVRAGVSATARIPLDTVEAHFLSPALLALDANGVLGAKSVDEDGRVVFHPVEIVRTELDGMWVTGLPENPRLITIGHGFVRPGEQVKAVAAARSDIDIEPAAGAPAAGG